MDELVSEAVAKESARDEVRSVDLARVVVRRSRMWRNRRGDGGRCASEFSDNYICDRLFALALT